MGLVELRSHEVGDGIVIGAYAGCMLNIEMRFTYFVFLLIIMVDR